MTEFVAHLLLTLAVALGAFGLGHWAGSRAKYPAVMLLFSGSSLVCTTIAFFLHR